MKKSPDVISWDKKGAVTVEGKSLEGSSISDLVSDQLRKRKGFQPQGIVAVGAGCKFTNAISGRHTGNFRSILETILSLVIPGRVDYILIPF